MKMDINPKGFEDLLDLGIQVIVISPNTLDKSRNSQYTLNVSTIHHIPLTFHFCAPNILFLTAINSPLTLFTILPQLTPNPKI